MCEGFQSVSYLCMTTHISIVVGTVMTYITAPEIELLAVSLTQVLAVVRCFLLYSPKCFYLLCVM